MSDDFFDLMQYGDAVQPATADTILKFTNRSGRYFFDVAKTSATVPQFFPVKVRIDPELMTLSGDLFKSKAKSRGENRQDWVMSWKSDAIYIYDQDCKDRPWDLAAICTVRRNNETPGTERDQILFMTIKFAEKDDHFSAASFRMAVIQNGKRLLEDYSLERAIELADGTLDSSGHYSKFREIRLNIVADDDLKADKLFDEILLNMLGNKGAEPRRLKEDLKRDGIYATRADYDDLVIRALDANIADPLFNHYLSLLDDPKPDPWTFTIILANDKDKQGENRFPLGRAIGLLGPANLFHNRTVAVIFPREIVASYVEANGAIDPENCSLADIEKLSFRLRHTIVHELAHLLNLPHPWNRGESSLEEARNEPQAQSWTNYGSLFPYGMLNQFAHTQQASKPARSKRANSMMHDVFQKHIGFTDQERMHINHASFDEIAAGQQTYTETWRQKLEMKDPSNGAYKIELDLFQPSGGGTGRTAKDPATGKFYGPNSHQTRLEPMTGTATLSVPEKHVTEHGDPHNLHFRFGSGNLFLLIREEHIENWPKNTFPRTHVYPLPSLTIGRLAHRRNQLVGTRLPKAGQVGAVDFQTLLPLILPIWMYKNFKTAKHFTFQAVYTPHGRSPIYSNQLCIKYVSDDTSKPFADAGNPIFELLRSKNMLLVSQAARYFDNPVELLPEQMTEIKELISDPRIADVIAGRPDLNWLALERKSILDAFPEPVKTDVKQAPIADPANRIIADRKDARCQSQQLKPDPGI